MSLRRLRVLIEHLPPESATKTAIRRDAPPSEPDDGARPDLAPWSHTDVLLASLLDATHLNRATLIGVNGGSVPEITPTPRPGIPPQKTGRKRLTDDQRRALDPRLRNEPREA